MARATCISLGLVADPRQQKPEIAPWVAKAAPVSAGSKGVVRLNSGLAPR